MGAAAGILFTKDATSQIEEEMRDAFGVERAWLVSSGTAALTLSLMALKGHRPQTDVVIPAYTCFSVPAAVMRAGLRPVPCDIDPATFDYEEDQLARTIGPNTLCVVAHNLFGIPANIERIRPLCRPYDCAIVEDAAQAMGVKSDGEWLGTRGDVGIFSLGRGKPITSGSGGVIVTKSPRLAAAIEEQCARLPTPSRVQMIKDWLKVALMAVFVRPSLFWVPSAVPWLRLGETVFPKHISLRRLSRMQAALLRGWRPQIDRANRQRAGTAMDLARRGGFELPCGPSHPYLRMPVFAANPAERNRRLADAQARGLGFSRAYPGPVSEIPEVEAVIGPRQFANALLVATHLLTVPTHHWVSPKDADAILACLSQSEWRPGLQTRRAWRPGL